MHTLVDFITHVKGIEYVLSLLFIAGFLLLWEVLKPAPFRTVMTTGREDLEHLRSLGGRELWRQAGKLAMAPLIGLLYVALLPFGFFFALLSGGISVVLKTVSGVLSRAGVSVSLDWRPMEAYFTGKKRKQSERQDKGSAQ